MSAALKVLVVAEGRSEIGDLDALAGGRRTKRRGQPCEGYVPPILRKLLGDDVQIDAQKITILRGKDARPRLAGHGDRAAKALRLAETEGYALVVFVKDVDRESGKKKSDLERRRKIEKMHREIDEGFASVTGAEEVQRAKATPCRMIEAWALGDPTALRAAVSLGRGSEEQPARPEELWGNEADPRSGHPKCVLRRVIGRQVDAELLERVAANADPRVLERSCPESFAPFAREVRAAAKALGRKR